MLICGYVILGVGVWLRVYVYVRMYLFDSDLADGFGVEFMCFDNKRYEAEYIT